MICCGEERLTPFCPQCGKKPGGVLGDLLAHVASLCASWEERVSGWKDPEEGDERRKETYARMRRNRDKWLSWKLALEAVLRDAK